MSMQQSQAVVAEADNQFATAGHYQACGKLDLYLTICSEFRIKRV